MAPEGLQSESHRSHCQQLGILQWSPLKYCFGREGFWSWSHFHWQSHGIPEFGWNQMSHPGHYQQQQIRQETLSRYYFWGAGSKQPPPPNVIQSEPGGHSETGVYCGAGVYCGTAIYCGTAVYCGTHVYCGTDVYCGAGFYRALRRVGQAQTSVTKITN